MARDKSIGTIIESKDYDKFHFVAGNRHIDVKHVKVLKAKITAKQILDPILVDKEFGILDGQHRFTARRELGLPIQYYVGESMTPEEIAQMNNVAKKWKPENYADVYITEPYRMYRSLKQLYPDFNHDILVALLTNGEGSGSKEPRAAFRDGTFEVKNYNKAVNLGRVLMTISQYSRVYKKRSFVFALLNATSVKGFDMSRFIRKLPHKGNVLKEYSRTDDFELAIEQLYNWKEAEDNRLRITRI